MQASGRLTRPISRIVVFCTRILHQSQPACTEFPAQLHENTKNCGAIRDDRQVWVQTTQHRPISDQCFPQQKILNSVVFARREGTSRNLLKTSIYQPLVHRVARRLGLQDADAENMVQEVIHKVGTRVSATSSPRPECGFRRWLSTVARHAALDVIRRAKPDAGRGGSSVQLALREIPEPPQLNSEILFRKELERQKFRTAAKRIRPEFNDATWTAFWETMVNGRACSEVAEQLGKTLGAIYTARCRVMQRLKDEVKVFD